MYRCYSKFFCFYDTYRMCYNFNDKKIQENYYALLYYYIIFFKSGLNFIFLLYTMYVYVLDKSSFISYFEAVTC